MATNNLKTTRPPIQLTDVVKMQIKALLTKGIPVQEIASMYNCSENQVRGIWSQMVQSRKRKTSRPAKSTYASSTKTPVNSPLVNPVSLQSKSDVFRRANNRNVVRIDASSFDEVILISGDNEIRVQISS